MRSGCLLSDPINLFYEEPNHDRWLPYDRYPRAVIRRVVRGRPISGGQKLVFLNLLQGLERIGVPTRVNDFQFAKRNPNALACIIGKPCILDKIVWRNPILFGSATSSHPIDDPNLLDRLPVRKVLVPGPWSKAMFSTLWGNAVEAWPVGIDTKLWSPSSQKTFDVLIYNKVRWDHSKQEDELMRPIRTWLRKKGVSFFEIRYGFYRPLEFRVKLAQCRAMIFVCEHETQGLAYQQALSCDVPVFAWNRGGAWRDPTYYPHRVVFEPVTSVPYWDQRCGLTFENLHQFKTNWEEFWAGVLSSRFKPREYIVENLTLEHCARAYSQIAQSLC